MKIFNYKKKEYENALIEEGYITNLVFAPPAQSKCKTRSSDTIWFNLPFHSPLKAKIGKIFLKLLDKYFPKSSLLANVFNRKYNETEL